MKALHYIYRTPRGLLLLTLLMVMVALTPGCTRNNGDIGDWFGTWRLEEITVDGEDDPDYPRPAMIWKFQGPIIQLLLPDDATHQCQAGTGSWHTDDGYLYVDFSWKIDGGWYDVIHLAEQSRLKVLHLSGSSMRLEYTSPESKVYTYRLRKWD